MSDTVLREHFEAWEPVMNGSSETNKFWGEHGFVAGYRAARIDTDKMFSEIGKLVPAVGDKLQSFENDPPDAIVDAVKRRLKQFEDALGLACETGHALGMQLIDAKALVGELVDAIETTARSSSYAHLDGRVRLKLMQALAKATKWLER